jgi:hypothetical protein
MRRSATIARSAELPHIFALVECSINQEGNELAFPTLFTAGAAVPLSPGFRPTSVRAYGTTTRHGPIKAFRSRYRGISTIRDRVSGCSSSRRSAA